jgi:hypothetical protein
MANLIYLTLASLDGYVADKDGTFGWAEPDEEVHAFVNDLARPVGTRTWTAPVSLRRSRTTRRSGARRTRSSSRGRSRR